MPILKIIALFLFNSIIMLSTATVILILWLIVIREVAGFLYQSAYPYAFPVFVTLGTITLFYWLTKIASEVFAGLERIIEDD